VQLLVEAGDDVNEQRLSFWRRTTSCLNIWLWTYCNVSSRKGADVGGNGGGPFYRTALEAAILKRHDHVASLLLHCLTIWLWARIPALPLLCRTSLLGPA
jgi:hypothetical protein